MQSNPVPTSICNNVWNDLIASGMVCFLQLQKLIFLALSRIQTDANGAFHRKKLLIKSILFSIFKRGAALPPSPKGLGFRAVY